MIGKICRERTQLSERDILQLERLEAQLPLIAELSEADVFIDCLLSDERAVVVAQACPTGIISAYEKSVVGQEALALNEPAVFHAVRLNAPVRDLKAVTQENRTVRQNVVPIRNDNHEIIAVLIREKDISITIQREKKFEALAKNYEREDYSLRGDGMQSPVSFDGVLSDDQYNEILLRETNHRVKNNLQLVASILNLQARKHRGTPAEAILTENVGRVLTIAELHDMFTHSTVDMRFVSSMALLERLCTNMKMFIPEDRNIQIRVEGDETEINANHACAIALVVNELITNALKHAFRDRDQGSICVSFCAGQLFHTITVRDDGCGFDQTEIHHQTMGLRIVEVTVKNKLHGTVRIHSDGTGTSISFDIRN